VPRELWPPARVLRGETLDGPETVDLLLRTLDGHDKHVNVSGRPLHDDAGRVVGGVTVMRDMTERWRLQHRAHDAFISLVQMAEALVQPPGTEESGWTHGEGVIRRLLDLARMVLNCKRASIVAIDGQSGVQRPVSAVGLSAEEECAWRALSQGSTLQEARLDPALFARFLAGEVVTVDMRRPPWSEQENPLGRQTALVAPLRMGSDLVGMLTIDHGDTAHLYAPDELALAGAVARLAALTLERERLLREREEARAAILALHETRRHMDELLGVASHELRTPLTSVKSAVQISQRRLRALAEAEVAAGPSAATLQPLIELFVRANQQINRMNRIVGDLLDISRIDANHLQLHLARFDLAALVGVLLQDLRESYPARAITCDLPAQAVPLDMDADRIAQVVTNYVTNALRYSPAETIVHVQVRAADGSVWLRVYDQGPGLTAEQQQRVWNRYERIPGVPAQDPMLHGSGGLGLGLYISRTLIERHGGAVGVESTPGVGSIFFFSLPLAG
jgi:signal transduction histidine kinase